MVYLPAGTGTTIIAYLHEKGIDVNGIDRRLLPLFGYPQRGWIDIGRTKLTKADFLYRLTHAKAAMTRVTLIPGETRVLFFDQLSEKLGLDREKLEKAYRLYAPFPEGVIWPDTYYIPIGITEKDLIYYLVGRSMRRHRRLAEKFFGIYDEKKWFRYVTIASIVQKEAADESEMPIVSAVIYNRIKRGMPLQMDGALNYGKYSHVKVTRKRIEEDRSRFNTYKFAGLPPYPVGSVSLEAIKAAVKPADVDYLYFVKGREGKHLFTKRYKTHLRNIKSVNK